MIPATWPPLSGRLSGPLAAACLAAIVLFAIGAVASPGTALGVTYPKAAICDVSLRARPTTHAVRRIRLEAGTPVSVEATVRGGAWSTKCTGSRTSGRSWYRITAIDGQSVTSLFGVDAVYGPTGRFKNVDSAPIRRYAACRVKLRTRADLAAPAKVTIKTDTKVVVTATIVRDDPWSLPCGDRTIVGRNWFRISRIDGRSVQALYGRPYLYAPKGLFKLAPTPDDTEEDPFAAMTEGIDVSHWQGSIDWPQVAAAGKRFVYMKASEGQVYVDPTYATNRQGARDSGLYVGAYHFAKPDTDAGDAIGEADHFVDTAVPVSGELLPVLDLERTGGLTKNQLIAWVKGFVGRVHERLGVRAVIYVSPNFWKTNMADTTWFADNGYEILWVAHWTEAALPAPPALDWSGHGWTFWQYTSYGAVPGIDGRVDLDRYNGTDFGPVLIP